MDEITLEEMQESIGKSGYLLEQRLENTLAKFSIDVLANEVYEDPNTGKSREIDLVAGDSYMFSGSPFHVEPKIIVECENNRLPIVFFEKDLDVLSESCFGCMYHRKTAGIPLDSSVKGASLGHELFWGDFPGSGCFTDTVSTQWCSFTRKNKNHLWTAYHPDEHYGTFRKIADCIEHFTDLYYERKPLNAQIYFPIVVLQGEMYRAKGDSLSEIEHMLFMHKQLNRYGASVYHIDVVTERYFEKFLSILQEHEIDFMIEVFKEYASEVFQMISAIESSYKDVSEKVGYRDYFMKYMGGFDVEGYQ